MSTIGAILLLLLDIAWWVLIAHIVVGWLVAFQVLNLRQPIVAQIYYGLNKLLEPIYGPIRRFLPSVGALDLSPIVVFIGIIILRSFIMRLMF